jgi:hypothetical protein
MHPQVYFFSDVANHFEKVKTILMIIGNFVFLQVLMFVLLRCPFKHVTIILLTSEDLYGVPGKLYRYYVESLRYYR